MEFAGPGDPGPVCLGKQGSKLTLSRPDSRRAELRVPRDQEGTEGLESAVSGGGGPCRQSGLRRSWRHRARLGEGSCGGGWRCRLF